MIRWLVLGTFLTLGTATIWGIAAQHAVTETGRIAWSVVGIVATAWLVPLWWIVNLVLYGIAGGLRYLRVTVLGDERLSEAYFAEVRERGTPWLVVAGEWGLKRYNAPVMVVAAVPEVIRYLAPLLDQPLETGLDQVRSDTAARLFHWQHAFSRLRAIWAALVFTPLWGGSLWLALL